MHNEPYWEKGITSLGSYDAIVVGAGFAGLSVATKLAQFGQRVVVLERSMSSRGASTRNAGFACFGSATELQRDIDRLGEQAAVELAATRLRGLLRLQREFDLQQIRYQPTGGFELIPEHTQVDINALNKSLRQFGALPEFETQVFTWLDSSQVPEHLQSQGYRVVRNGLEGVLHPQHLHVCMLRKALECGVVVLFGHTMKHIFGSNVQCEAGGLTAEVQGGHVYVCTNGLDQNLTGEVVAPGRGQIVVTEPWPGNPYRGGWHMNRGYYYFREVDGRLLLGGGRQTDIEGETATELVTTPGIQNHLQDVLLELLPEGLHLNIEYSWAGIMGFTANGLPHIQRVNEYQTHVCVCNGMGVALARELIYSEPTIGGAEM